MLCSWRSLHFSGECLLSMALSTLLAARRRFLFILILHFVLQRGLRWTSFATMNSGFAFCLKMNMRTALKHGGFFGGLGIFWGANPFWENSTWKEEEKERIMPSLVATMSALARKPCVRAHYVRNNYQPFFTSLYTCL